MKAGFSGSWRFLPAPITRTRGLVIKDIMLPLYLFKMPVFKSFQIWFKCLSKHHILSFIWGLWKQFFWSLGNMMWLGIKHNLTLRGKELRLWTGGCDWLLIGNESHGLKPVSFSSASLCCYGGGHWKSRWQLPVTRKPPNTVFPSIKEKSLYLYFQ